MALRRVFSVQAKALLRTPLRANHSTASVAAVSTSTVTTNAADEAEVRPSWARFRPELWRKPKAPSGREFAPYKEPQPQAWVTSLTNERRGIVSLDADIWAQEIRKDVLQRVIEWQRARARIGRNKTLKRGEVQETGKKIYKQKGMGVARRRHRTAAPHMRGGGKAHGQTLRDFDIDLPKKVRSLGLKIALSAKYQEGSLTVINSTDIDTHRTTYMNEVFTQRGFDRKDLILVIGGPNTSDNFLCAIRNLPNVNYLPVEGANVKDILKHHALYVTLEAMRYLEARLHKMDVAPASELESEEIALAGEEAFEEDFEEEAEVSEEKKQ